MAAPTSDWESSTATSVTVDVVVDDRAPQQMVLFEGDRPHTYRGFLGPLRPGRHDITIELRADLSAPPTHPDPVARIEALVLAVYPPDTPAHDAVAHAPVLYGRDVNNRSDVPLVGYYEQRSVEAGTRYRYTTIYSNEDGGGGVSQAYLMGVYGRGTDIEWTAALTVAEDGAVRHGKTTYHSCGRPLVSSAETCFQHSSATFDGEYFHGHPILRVASANGVLSDDGEETSLRFQPPNLGATPRPGRKREDAMDRQPFTYRVMDKELKRESPANSTAPAPGFTYGDARQYVYATVRGDVENGSVALDVKFREDPVFYANDYTGSGPAGAAAPAKFPFYTGGHSRTAIKAPRDVHDRTLEAIRFRLGPAEDPARNGQSAWNPANAAGTIDSIRLFTLGEAYEPSERAVLDASVSLDASNRTETREL